MSEGSKPLGPSIILRNIPVSVPSPDAFSQIGLNEDIYETFLNDVEVMAQQIVQKYMVQLTDAATEGAGLVAEPVIKAAVNVDKALNEFVKKQAEHALKDRERRGTPKTNGNQRKRKRKRRRTPKRS